MGFLSSLRRDIKGGTKAYKDLNSKRNKWVDQNIGYVPEVATDGDGVSSIELTPVQQAALAKVNPGSESGGDSGGFIVSPEYQSLKQQFEAEQWKLYSAAQEKRKQLGVQWLDTLDPAAKQKAIKEFSLHSSDIGAINKYGSLASKAIIGGIAGGAALTAAGVIGGGASSVSAGAIEAAAGIPELGMAAQTGLGIDAATAAGALGGAGEVAGTAASVAGAAPAVSSAGIQAGVDAAALAKAGVAAPAPAAGGSVVAGLTGVELAKLGLAGIGTLAGYGSSKDATAAAENAAKSATNSADAATQLGRDNLDFTKQQYNDAKPYRDAAAKTAQEVSEAQLAQMKQQDELAREYADYNRTTFRPLEQGIVADAAGYDTPEKRNAAAIAAQADVNKGFSAVNSATARRLAASGIDPGSTRAMSVMDGQAIEQAKANAGAAYTARKGVETTGFARKMDAASLGRNLPSSQATTAGLALTAGNSATGNSGAALQAVNTGVPQVQNAYNSAVQATATGGGLYNSAAQLAQRAGVISADQWGQLGDSLGNWANSKGGNATLTKWFGS